MGKEAFCMEYEEDLKKLEDNVEKMLSSLDSVQGDKIKLQADIARLELDKKGLEEQIKRLKEEKKSIHQRVSGLLGSIEKWEKSTALETASLSSANVIGKESSEPVQGVLIGN
jgi:septal ring factor EnvC (AmiA/AmiB activator)